MMILIVGGRYGSNASDQKDRYEKQYVSITRKEYETARRKGIPVIVFVEQNVFVEYKTFLANGGEIYFKTDDDELFEGSFGYFEEAGFSILKKTYDLHSEPIWENNIETEHEKMFSEQGIKIKALIAKYNK